MTKAAKTTKEAETQRVSRLMKANKSTNTKPELLLRKAVWKAGLRGYRLHYKGISGRPDLSFLGKRLAVFVHGCFWHQCPRCEGKKAFPRSNQEFWRAKFAENVARDARVQAELQQSSWRFIVLWECEVSQNAAACANRIKEELAVKG